MALDENSQLNGDVTRRSLIGYTGDDSRMFRVLLRGVGFDSRETFDLTYEIKIRFNFTVLKWIVLFV